MNAEIQSERQKFLLKRWTDWYVTVWGHRGLTPGRMLWEDTIKEIGHRPYEKPEEVGAAVEQQIVIDLHRSLDVTLAWWISETKGLPSQVSAMNLVKWLHEKSKS